MVRGKFRTRAGEGSHCAGHLAGEASTTRPIGKSIINSRLGSTGVMMHFKMEVAGKLPVEIVIVVDGGAS